MHSLHSWPLGLRVDLRFNYYCMLSFLQMSITLFRKNLKWGVALETPHYTDTWRTCWLGRWTGGGQSRLPLGRYAPGASPIHPRSARNTRFARWSRVSQRFNLISQGIPVSSIDSVSNISSTRRDLTLTGLLIALLAALGTRPAAVEQLTAFAKLEWYYK